MSRYTDTGPPIDHSADKFREAQRKFKLPAVANNKKDKRARKAKLAAESFDGVIDFDKLETLSSELKSCVHRITVSSEALQSAKLNSSARVYRLDLQGQPSGMYVIRNALSLEDQLSWAHQCLSKYSKAEHTNVTNLAQTQQMDDTKASQVKADNTAWEDAVSSDNFTALYKLRWASLGYWYDWTARKYTKDARTSMPDDLVDFGRSIGSLVGGYSVLPEAAIINFYLANSVMGGHVDNAELTQTKPIVSASLGCKCIFLLGTTSKTVAPVPFYLHSGDVCVQGGVSRLYYHGVPRIFERSFLEDFDGKTNDERIAAIQARVAPRLTHIPADELTCVIRYLCLNRINFNVRQVVESMDDWDTQSKEEKQSLSS